MLTRSPKSSLRGVLRVLALATLLSHSSSADAQVRQWNGPPGCDDGDALFSRVVAPGLDMEATVTLLENRLQLRLELQRGGERWQRVVVGDSCEALVEVAVVVATMAAELQLPESDVVAEPCDENCAGELAPEAQDAPSDVAETVVTEPVTREPSEPTGDTPRFTPPVDRAPRFEWPERWSLSAHVGARFDALTLPSPRAAVDLGLHLRNRWVRLDIGVVATRIASVTLDDASAELGLAAGRLGACGGTTSGRFWLGGCAAFELGVVRALGRGVDQPRDEGSFWAGLDVGLRGELGLIGRLSLYVEAGALVPLRRPRFLLQGAVVHTTPAISPRAALGLELRLTR